MINNAHQILKQNVWIIYCKLVKIFNLQVFLFLFNKLQSFEIKHELRDNNKNPLQLLLKRHVIGSSKKVDLSNV